MMGFVVAGNQVQPRTFAQGQKSANVIEADNSKELAEVTELEGTWKLVSVSSASKGAWKDGSEGFYEDNMNIFYEVSNHKFDLIGIIVNENFAKAVLVPSNIHFRDYSGIFDVDTQKKPKQLNILYQKKYREHYQPEDLADDSPYKAIYELKKDTLIIYRYSGSFGGAFDQRPKDNSPRRLQINGDRLIGKNKYVFKKVRSVPKPFPLFAPRPDRYQ